MSAPAAPAVPGVRSQLNGLEIWFVTGSQQPLRRGDPPPGGRPVPRDRGARSTPRRSDPGPRRLEAGAHRRRTRSGGSCWTASRDDSVIGVIAWMHTFSPAKMWIGGLERARASRCCTCTPRPTSRLPWADIDFDFMNLNQAAHGDREFGYIQTRLGVAPQDRRRPRVRPARGRRRSATWARAAAGLGGDAGAEAGPVRRQHALRRGHRGRQDRGRGRLRRPGQHLGRQRPGRRRWTTCTDADIDALVDGVRGQLRRRARAARGGERHQSLRDGAAIELGLRVVPRRRRVRRVHHQLRGPGRRCKQLPGLAVQRLMADGYGFGAEGDWKTAMLVRAAKVMGQGLPGGASLMEDYTYDLTPGQELHPRRAHARGLPHPHHRPGHGWRSTRCPSAAARTRCGWSSPPTPGPASSSR